MASESRAAQLQTKVAELELLLDACKSKTSARRRMRSIPVGHWDRFSLFHLGGTLLWQTWLCSEEGGIQDGSRWEEGLHVGGYFHFSRVGWDYMVTTCGGNVADVSIELSLKQ